MKTEFTDQARAAVCRLFGDAVYELVAAGMAVTNENMAEVIAELANGEPDLAADFALQLLKTTSCT